MFAAIGILAAELLTGKVGTAQFSCVVAAGGAVIYRSPGSAGGFERLAPARLRRRITPSIFAPASFVVPRLLASLDSCARRVFQRRSAIAPRHSRWPHRTRALFPRFLWRV